MLKNKADILQKLDKETLKHSLNVAGLALSLGEAANLSNEALMELTIGALFHDIGKIFIPKAVLFKKGRLTQEEMSIMKTHSILGYNYMKAYSDLSENSLKVILDNHERIDGSGYPNGKKDDEISYFAKIVSICDVYDALVNKRTYKESMSKTDAIAILNEGRGSEFDSDLLSLFIQEVVKWAKVRQHTADIARH